MTRDQCAKAIIIHLTGQPEDPSPMLLSILDGYWNEAAKAMRRSIAASLREEAEKHVHENWSYDGSTGAWETRNTASEEWVNDREELAEVLSCFPIPVSP